MTAREAQCIQSFAAEVRRRFGDWVEDLVLFGSRARDTAAPWSDWDVLAITRERDRDRESELIGLAFDWLLSDHINVSIKCMTRAQRDRQIEADAPFMRNVLRDGKSLWTQTTPR